MLGKFFNNKQKIIISKGDIKIGYKDNSKVKSNKTPIIIPYNDRFLHTLIVGPAGCGKSSQLIKPMIKQDLENKDLGITLIEPKGDLSIDVFMMAKYYEREVIYFNPILEDCPHINIFESKSEEVSRLLISSFESLLSEKTKEEKELNELLITSSVKAVKVLYSEKATIIELNNLINNIDGKGIKIANKLIETNKKENIEIGKWFLNDYLVNDNKKEYKNLKETLNKIVTNKYLGKILNLPENTNNIINFDKALEKGTILIFNTSQGDLRDLGYYLGQFIINKYTLAVLNRANTDKRANICYIDEFQVYKNNSIKNLLTIGRTYNISMNLSIQSNLQLEDDKEFMDVILSNTRSKVVFPGISIADSHYYNQLFTEITNGYFNNLNKKRFSKNEITKEEVLENLTKINLIYREFGKATYSIINNNENSCPGVLKIEYIDKDLDDIINNMTKKWTSKHLN